MIPFSASAELFKTKKPDPVNPTVAPFTTDGSAPKSNSKLMGFYDQERAEDVVPIDKPHRTTEQMADWSVDHVTTAMNIDPLTWDAHLKTLTPYFDAYGLQEYQSYLQSSGILNLLQTNRLKINSILDGAPTLLSQGALSGTYRWLYQVPLMITYYEEETKTLKTRGVKSQNQKLVLRVQIGRVAKGSDDNNIVIEHWTLAPSN